MFRVALGVVLALAATAGAAAARDREPSVVVRPAAGGAPVEFPAGGEATVKVAIEIAADDVTLDLNGFELCGVPGSIDGVRVTTTLRTLSPPAFDGQR